MTMRIAITALLLANSIICVHADEVPAPRKRGEALAERMCASCHAIGRADQSLHLGAPALRALDRRVDIDGFVARLRDGLTSGHPDMPTYRFTRADARALVAYLRSIEAP
jgi:mono/diheme cytochrome c family protein